MFKNRSWFGGGLWKPKNPHSLDHLKYLYNVLSKNQTVCESNRGLLVETLRSIAEILIWGDQNDSTVFDFFLEKNMLSFFLKIMKQKCGSYVCVQLLQTLNILFENIRNETSLYYLLSNNHVNSIVVHKFDFSDEEVMAYYISFLKTLSLKLNSHTIHFFYNEHTNDFPLYTEAIKFFNHSESMVRIAVRTLTLNVYRVDDRSMQKFIRNKTAVPYFSNLVWFIGNHVLELDDCIKDSADMQFLNKLGDLVAEHLDHLHYLNDILRLNIDPLNQVLTDHLLHRLLVPLYIASLNKESLLQTAKSPPKVSMILSLFLLSQVFLIIGHPPLVRVLFKIIIYGNASILCSSCSYNSGSQDSPTETNLPIEDNNSLEGAIETVSMSPQSPSSTNEEDSVRLSPSSISLEESIITTTKLEEELENLASKESDEDSSGNETDFSNRPFLSSLFEVLNCVENDYAALFSLCLLHSFIQNRGIENEVHSGFFKRGSPTSQPESDQNDFVEYNERLVDCLVNIITEAVKYDSKVRVVTLQLVQKLLLLCIENENGDTRLKDRHLASIEGAKEENILVLQKYYRTDEMFLEIFEDEHMDLSLQKDLSIERLLMDSSLLLPPAGSPLTGIALDKRLPCGEGERSRRALRVYFILRKLSLKLRNETEKDLPLTKAKDCVHVDENLNLNNCDLFACSMVAKDNTKLRRFLVIELYQLILVEPSKSKMGWGVAKFVGFLQDIEVVGDQHDSRCLHITVKSSHSHQRRKTPLLVATFIFDDYIRCMAAKQRLVKGRHKARESKLCSIGKLLDQISSPSPPPNLRKNERRKLTRADRALYNPISKTLPGLAMAVISETSHHLKGRRKSRERSPSILPSGTKPDEEIPLSNIKGSKKSSSKGATSTSTTSVPTTSSFAARPNRITVRDINIDMESETNHPVRLLSREVTQNSDGGEKNTCSGSGRIGSPVTVTTPQSETSFMTPNNTEEPVNARLGSVGSIALTSPDNDRSMPSSSSNYAYHKYNTHIHNQSNDSQEKSRKKNKKGAILTV